FAEGWKLEGAGGQFQDEHGAWKSFVVVKTADAKNLLTFLGNEPQVEGVGAGVCVEAINRSEITGKTTVIFRKGARSAVVETDQMQVNLPVPQVTLRIPVPSAAPPLLKPAPTPPRVRINRIIPSPQPYASRRVPGKRR